MLWVPIGALLVGIGMALGRAAAVADLRRWGPGLAPEGRRAWRETARVAIPRRGARQAGGDAETLGAVVAEVSAHLRAGLPVETAWTAAWASGRDLPEMGAVAEDGVPKGLLDVGAAGGAAAGVARSAIAACRLSHGLGAPLADVLDTVVAGIDDVSRTEAARRVASAGPRMSARVLTALPLVGVLLGQLCGADPLRFLTSGGGILAGVSGVLLLAAGHVVTWRMLADGPGDGGAFDPALLCDLCGAGLRAGASIPRILADIGHAVEQPELGRIASELVLGATWDRAWDPMPDGWMEAARCLEPAWQRGTSPVVLLARAAQRWREGAAARAREQSEALAVRLVIPLGTLLLPAFVLLGVLPLVVHLGGGMSGIFTIG